MEGGAVVEEGSHEALIRRGGLYARLAALQFEGEPFRREAAE
jgi:ATP-binding cassette subfamily B protein